MLGGAGSPGGDDLLTVTVVRDEHGYGMKVSGDNPVYVQSVKEHGAAWRAGLRAGDRILRVDNVPVQHHSHQQVVHLIRTNPTTVLTVQQNTSRLKTPITAPVPANLEKQRQFEASKIKTMRLMLEKEQKYHRDLRNELLKVPDVRKQAELESAEQRCTTLQHEIDLIIEAQLAEMSRPLPTTPRSRMKSDKPSPIQNTGFLSGLPRSLSNLTGQSLRNLRQARQKDPPLLVRQNSDESNNKRRHIHNNTVPMVPTTCLDNVAPPPLPPRSMERSKRSPISPPPMNPMAKGNPSKYYKRLPEKPCVMHQSMPSPYKEENMFRRSSHSLDGELEGPQPNSIALQMSYPLVNAPPPPLQTDNRTGVPVLHVRSRSSPEQLDHDLNKSTFSEPNNRGTCSPCLSHSLQPESVRDTPPPGTPPPPYHTNTQPCSDPQRAIISMEEDDSPASDNSSYSGLFSNLRSVRESKARTAVLLNWLLGERRCACACLLLVLTDGYRTTDGVPVSTLRRWAYEIHSTFLTPHAVLQLNGVDENMANEIEHVLVNEYEKEELIRSVFRKARAKAKEELSIQLADFQLKRQLGLATLYAPSDDVIDKCDVDKAQEQAVVEQLLCAQLRNIAGGGVVSCTKGNTQHEQHEAHNMLLAALVAAALCLHCRPASVAAAAGGQRATFLQKDKFYKQRVKQITKQNPQPFVVRGHHLSLMALTSVAHCHYCDHVVSGLAPQAYVCNDCKLRVHRGCARHVEEACCLDGEHQPTRISRFMDRIHNPNNGLDSGDKKSRKASSHFLNMERSFRKAEDDQLPESNLTSTPIGETKREGSNEESTAADRDGEGDAADLNNKEAEKENSFRTGPGGAGGPAAGGATGGGRGVNRAESCRERDAPRRGKHRNASDPNRLTAAAHNHTDLEPGAATAPSGSSSSSSLSSRSNESNTVAAEQHASQSELSDEEEPLAAQWADSVPPHVLASLTLSARLRKRQELIHELIVSESSHVRWLRVLGRVFHRPLTTAALLPTEDLRALFPNLPAVKEKHVRLLTELRALRNEPIVAVIDVAKVLLDVLGESGYAGTVARFCRGQRLALDTLRERRRKNKELHQFLAVREQLPSCGRLQLRDLLATVWQRLTKYQLLLEGMIKTISFEEGDCEDDLTRLNQALNVAKDVLHTVDTAIRTTENEHRLRGIQNKLEIRAAGNEWDELRKLELPTRTLHHEGELAVRHDANKKTHMLALMLEDCLVLFHREGDKFVLKPIPQPSPQLPLSPLVRWDKVLFRPNAAVRNTFFLMNINGVQMHELSANSASEYATWVKHIQEAPLAKLTELKPNITPSHHATRSTDDSGINVSRNPSDASEKSDKSTTSTGDVISDECERDRTSVERSSSERDRDRDSKEEERVVHSPDKEEEKEEKHKIRRPTVGRISTHGSSPPPLETHAAVTVTEPPKDVMVAEIALSTQERLRRLDEIINRSLLAKASLVSAALGVPSDHQHQVAEMAVAETLGQVDSGTFGNDFQQLVLAAYTQAEQITQAVRAALVAPSASAVVARAGRCRHCHARSPLSPADVTSDVKSTTSTRVDDASYDTLSDIEATSCEGNDDVVESSIGASLLAARLAGPASGLQSALSALLSAEFPARDVVPILREENHALRNHLIRLENEKMEENISLTKSAIDPFIPDQPSNGG